MAGTTAANKVYDATTAATVSGGTLSGLISGDAVTLSQSGAFADKNAGTGKTVMVANSVAGADASNYVLSNASQATTASITAATLTVAGTTAQDKVYDATTAATVSGGALSGVLGGDAVTLASQTGAFSDPQVGTDKTVNVVYTLSGVDAGNYVVSGSAARASILAATSSSTVPVSSGAGSTAGGTVVTTPQLPVVTADVTTSAALVAVTPLRAAPNPVPIEALPAMAEAMVMLEPTAGVTLQASRSEASLVQVMLPAGFNPLFPGALRVALPEAVLDQATGQDPVRVTLTDGSPLPQWVRYDPLTGSLSFLSAPPQAWPLEVMVVAGNHKMLVRLQQPTLWAAQD